MQRRHFLTASVLTLLGTPLLQAEDPWSADALLAPDDFARQLASDPARFSIVCVGFPVLYKGAHITNALLAGPCSKPQGIEKLHQTIGSLAKQREIVLYCGCCPFSECPNIRPAYASLRGIESAHVKVLNIPANLDKDWVKKGYPIQRSL